MIRHHLSRRTLLGALATVPFVHRSVYAQDAGAAGPFAFSFPIGRPGAVLGDGFFMRHGYATENTWYNPGWLHTAEDWYALEGETGGASVYAIADGEIVFAGSEYPGLVVIVRHADDLFSMYGHLDHTLAIGSGAVTRGQLLGTVLYRTDGRAPSHLHFETRTFLTTPEVNGEAPRYGMSCGYNCPPGPGYWPIDAPEHPSDFGWRNPTHVMGRRMIPAGDPPGPAEVIVPAGANQVAALWVESSEATQLGDLVLRPGDRYPLLAVDAGPEDARDTGADAYRFWFQIDAPEIGPAWARAAVPSTNDTMSDGRPASVRFDLLPNVTAP